MILKLFRQPIGIDGTIGVLFLDGYFECFTLENSKEIIPIGTYELEEYLSPKNKRYVPLLKDVPGRSMIEIHIANWYDQLEGCIAVGRTFNDVTLYDSKKAFDRLMGKLDLNNSTIEITQL